MPQLALDGEQVRQGLGGVAVRAVAGVDDGHAGHFGGVELGTLNVVAHGNYIGKAAHYAHGVAHGFSLAHGRVFGVGEAQDVAAQLHHGRCKTESGAGGGLIKERSQLAVGHTALIAFAVGDDVLRQGNDFVGLLLGEIHRVNEVLHIVFVFI